MWRAERLVNALPIYRGKDSPQNIESTLDHWEHMLSLRVYAPNERDRTWDAQGTRATTHYDWIVAYNDQVEGEARNPSLAYVRQRTYGLISRELVDNVVGTRLLYNSTPDASGGSFHNVQMIADPDDTSQVNLQRTRLVHYTFQQKLDETQLTPPRIVGVHLLHWQYTWCGDAFVTLHGGERQRAFWRLLSKRQGHACQVNLNQDGSCTCAADFTYNLVIRHERQDILVRVLPTCALRRMQGNVFRLNTHTMAWVFASPLQYYEEPDNARLVLDPFFASPFSMWLVFCLNHSLRWRMSHVDGVASDNFVRDFLKLSHQYKGDELQFKLQLKFPLENIDATKSPIVATNPPFFFRQSMFENLFRAHDVVVMCSETDRTSRIMERLHMRKLYIPAPSAIFMYYNNGVLSTSRPNVRVALRYWVTTKNTIVDAPPPQVVAFDPLLNELLIHNIILDGIGDFGPAGLLIRPNESDIDRVQQKTPKCLAHIVANLINDKSRGKKLHKLAALFYAREVRSEILSAYVNTEEVWMDAIPIAADYWNTIDSVVATYPNLVSTHYDAIILQPERLQGHSFLDFSLAAPNVTELQESITSPNQVDPTLYEPIIRWYARLEEVDNWLREPLPVSDFKALARGLAQLQTDETTR
jgi:hypothetical protein